MVQEKQNFPKEVLPNARLRFFFLRMAENILHLARLCNKSEKSFLKDVGCTCLTEFLSEIFDRRYKEVAGTPCLVGCFDRILNSCEHFFG